MEKPSITKYLWVILSTLLLGSVITIGVLLYKGSVDKSKCNAAEVNNTSATETESEPDKCTEEELSKILERHSWSKIERIENETSYGVVLTGLFQKEDDAEYYDCLYYITNIVENGLGVSNLELGAIREVVHMGSGTIAYNYDNVIYTQNIVNGEKAKVVVDQSIAAEALDGEDTVIIDGPYLIDSGSKSGISTTGQFIFSVNYLFDCETDLASGLCDESLATFNELKDKNITGLWKYSMDTGKTVYLEEN